MYLQDKMDCVLKMTVNVSDCSKNMKRQVCNDINEYPSPFKVQYNALTFVTVGESEKVYLSKKTALKKCT